MSFRSSEKALGSESRMMGWGSVVWEGGKSVEEEVLLETR